MKRIGLLLTLFVLLLSWCMVSHGQTSNGPKSPGQQEAEKAGLTAQIIQAYLAKKESMLATGVGSSPKSATVTIESIRFGASRKATEKDRVVNGITAAVVYPVRVRYTSHRRWGNGQTEDKAIHYDHEFFTDSFGDWTSYLVGPVR